MKEDARIVSPQAQPEDDGNNANPVNLRPNSLSEFVGQREVCENLKVFIEAERIGRWISRHVGTDDYQVGRFGGNFN